MKPERSAGTNSAWREHIPFAFFTMAVHKPSLFVELGTHTGASYCAFCQAADTLMLPAKCYAVDLWTGDEHSGFYGEEVFQNLSEYHDSRYLAFSNLLRMSFDDAAGYFSDGTIDLLHIDGCHHYEAVRNDFETWLPKMSPSGVVLLHDVLVRDRGFGVWRLLEELRSQYPVFEFTHGFGLGVVGVGPELPGQPIWNVLWENQENTVALRRLFMTLGHRITTEDEMNESVARNRRANSEIEKMLQVLQVKESNIQEMQCSLQTLLEERDAKNFELEESHKSLDTKNFELEELHKSIQLLKDHNSRIELDLQSVKSSWVWKILLFLTRHQSVERSCLRFKALVFHVFLKRRNIREIAKFAAEHNRAEAVEGKTVSVVMLTFNRLRDTRASLKALYRNTTIPFELIILDNGSDARELRFLERFSKKHNNIKLIFEKDNLGCAGGRRKAFSHATGDYVVSIDNDISVTPFCIENLLRTLEEYRDVAGACCKSVLPNGLIQFNGGRTEIRNNTVTFHLIDCYKDYRDQSTMGQSECDWIPGGATIWRKEIIREFEIDPEMRGSYEDNEIAFVLKKAGFRLFNCPSAIAVHNTIEFNFFAEKQYLKQRFDFDRIKYAIGTFYKKHGLLIQDELFYCQAGLDANNPEKVISEVLQERK